jgi:hypothetical protein
MRKHDNCDAFRTVPFTAWTNSSRHIYVDARQLITLMNDLMAQGTAPTEAVAMMRAAGLMLIRHELHHVTQFLGNGNAPPASFGAMVAFEEQAYGDDVTWLQNPQTQSMLTTTTAVSAQGIAQLESIVDDAEKAFHAIAAQQHGDDTLNLKAMQDKDFLPDLLGGKAKYAVRDLYKTKAP